MSTGIVKRHARKCASRADGSCNCKPHFEAWAWDKRAKKKISRSFSNASEAKSWRRDATELVRQGGLRKSSLTFRAAAEGWLEACERGEVLSRHRRPYKPSVLRGYRSDLERYVFDDLGAHRLSDMTADDFQALVDRLVGSGLSGSKVRNVLVPCQALYRRHRRQVLADPTDGLDLPEAGGRRERAASPGEAAELLGRLPEEDAVLWATAFYAGLRRGELRALRASAVDLEQGAITVERSWDDVAGDVDPKSRAGIRQVPIPETLRAILAEHLERSGRSGEQFLLGRTPHAPFTPTHVRKRALKAWAAAAVGAFLRGEAGEVEPIGLHEARHSYSTYLDAAGISETRADRYMGHSNPSVANRYRHQLAGQLAEDARTLEAYLAGARRGRVIPLTGVQAGVQETETRTARQIA